MKFIMVCSAFCMLMAVMGCGNYCDVKNIIHDDKDKIKLTLEEKKRIAGHIRKAAAVYFKEHKEVIKTSAIPLDEIHHLIDSDDTEFRDSDDNSFYMGKHWEFVLDDSSANEADLFYERISVFRLRILEDKVIIDKIDDIFEDSYK